MRSRYGMPLFTYLAIVGPALVGLLYVADAHWGQPELPKLGAVTYTLADAPPDRARPKVSALPILTVTPAPMPTAADMASAEEASPADVPLAQATPVVEPLKEEAKVVKPRKKKIARAHAPRDL